MIEEGSRLPSSSVQTVIPASSMQSQVNAPQGWFSFDDKEEAYDDLEQKLCTALMRTSMDEDFGGAMQ